LRELVPNDRKVFLIDNSTAPIADVQVIPAASNGGFNLVSICIAGGEAVAVRRVSAKANPICFVVVFVCNLFNIVSPNGLTEQIESVHRNHAAIAAFPRGYNSVI